VNWGLGGYASTGSVNSVLPPPSQMRFAPRKPTVSNTRSLTSLPSSTGKLLFSRPLSQRLKPSFGDSLLRETKAYSSLSHRKSHTPSSQMGFAPMKPHRFGQPSSTGKLPCSRPLSQRLKPFFRHRSQGRTEYNIPTMYSENSYIPKTKSTYYIDAFCESLII
jgi:hypothetical protein